MIFIAKRHKKNEIIFSLMHPQGFHSYWENQPLEQIQQQSHRIEQSLQELKQQLFAHAVNRRQFYPQFEQKSMELMQLHRLLKIKCNRREE